MKNYGTHTAFTGLCSLIDLRLTPGYRGAMFVTLQELVEARNAYRTCFANLEAFINKVRTRGGDLKLAHDILQPVGLPDTERLESPMYNMCHLIGLNADPTQYWWGVEQNRKLAISCDNRVYNIIDEAHEIFSTAATQAMTPLDRKRKMVKGAGLMRVVLTCHQNEELLVELEDLLRAILEGFTSASTVNVQ
ncbi:hypothetical protein FGRMN_6833 [Fusarium graminum]|nr:hypothetical protein FGRMN_6833 [Fusarium graminum]